VAARLDTDRVILDVPEPGAAMETGLNLTVTPVGWPVADKAMAEAKPPETLVVMTASPLESRGKDPEVGETERVKPPAVVGAVTVSDTVAVFVIPPPVPITAIVYVPAAVVGATAIVMIEAPDPGAPIGVGLKLTVTPAGWPAAVKAMAESNPPETMVVIVDVALLPCATETDAGEAEMVKAVVVVTEDRALISPVFGLPQPVTRS